MNSHADMRSFEAARRRQLIEATIDTVADLGFRAASLSEIARRANVSQGLFAHYFGDKDGLLEATLRHMAARLPLRTAIMMRAARNSLERVLAVSDSALADQEFERRTSAVWLAFWGQIVHSEPYRRVQAIYQRRTRSNLRHGLRDLVAADRVELCATQIAAAIDGLWLQSHASDEAGDKAARARLTVRDLIATLIDAHGPARSRSAASSRGPRSGPDDALFAGLDAARAAWSATDGDRRAALLRRLADRLAADRAAIARRRARETGLPVADAEAHDLPRAVRAFERASEAARRPAPSGVSFGAGAMGLVCAGALEPLLIDVDPGAAVFETAALAAHGLAGGRAVAVCVPEEGARTFAKLAEAAAKAGLPDGLLTVVQGPEAARLLLSRPAGGASLRPGAPKSAALVAADADLRDAASKLVRGPRAWARARAFSETLIFVDERVRQAFVERLAAEVATLEMGDPLDPGVEVGPLASRAALERAVSLIQEARAAGARIRLGGREHETPGRSRAAFLKPTLLDGARDADAITREALHAPIFVVCPFGTAAEAAARLSDLPNLSLVAFGHDVDALVGLAREARAAVCRLDAHSAPLPSSADDWLLEPCGAGGRTTKIVWRGHSAAAGGA